LTLIDPAIPTGLKRRDNVQADGAGETGHFVREILVKDETH
jgi:hypothetical protein